LPRDHAGQRRTVRSHLGHLTGTGRGSHELPGPSRHRELLQTGTGQRYRHKFRADREQDQKIARLQRVRRSVCTVQYLQYVQYNLAAQAQYLNQRGSARPTRPASPQSSANSCSLESRPTPTAVAEAGHRTGCSAILHRTGQYSTTVAARKGETGTPSHSLPGGRSIAFPC
jgi:hypothetical protein